MKDGFNGPLIDTAGAIDLHCHPYPDLFPRLADDFDIVGAARDASFRAIVLKCHHESTVSRAYLVNKATGGIGVFGGVVLNSYVGFLNPAAVDAALRLGGKVVWMPTIDAGYHAEIHGGAGGYDSQAGGRGGKGVWVLNDDGTLRSEVLEIFELVAQHDAILGTCHLSPREIVALVKAATERGIERVVVTHPFFRVPNLDLDTVAEVASMGAYPEFGYCTVSPAWHYATPEKVAEAIKRVGASRCLLVSDTGQRHNPLPSEALRIWAQTLFEKGVSGDDVDLMIKRNPAQLLGLDATWSPEPQASTDGAGAAPSAPEVARA